MNDVDNPEVGADATATEGQNQELNVLGSNTGHVDAPVADTSTAEPADWKSSLPEELKSAKSLASINTVEDLVKSYVNAQSVVGRRFEDLTPEQVREFYGSMGAPESAEGYEFAAPEGVELNKELESWYRQKSHEYGIPKEAAEKLFSDYMALEQDQTGQLEQLREIQAKEEIAQLKKDFGPAYDERTALANKALAEFGGEEAAQLIQEAGLGSNPTLVKLLANAGELLSESKFVSGQTTGKFGMTSEEASGKIDGLRRDPEFMKHYMNPQSAQHASAKKQMEDLYKIRVNAG